jgi:hypothetical protein
MGIVKVSVFNFYRLYIDHLTTGLRKASFARKLAMYFVNYSHGTQKKISVMLTT